jgi:hypothetical protein
MRVLSFAVAVLLLVPVMLLADAASVKPALTSNVAIGAGDSPLVRAAKIAVASRMGVPSRVIDNSTVASATRTLTTTSVNVTLPTYGSTYGGGQQAAPGMPPTYPTARPNRAELQKNLQQLNQENARMHDEADQPYGGDVSEDRVQQRIEQLPQEIQGTQQQLTPMPPSHPPGNQP